MQPDPQQEKYDEEEDAFLQLPATRWDRLVAVLEANEPERAIDAPHILERAKKLHMSDMDLFYLLLLHYQENLTTASLDVLSLYVMMSTWIDWLKQVQRCFDVKKGKMDCSASRSTTLQAGCASRAVTETDFQHTSRSGSNLGNSQHTSPLTGDSPTTSIVDNANFSNSSNNNNNNNNSCGNNSCSGPTHQRDSGSRTGRGRGHSNMRSHRSRTGRSCHTSSIHCCFDLGQNWEWDGSLDFLRDGHVLSQLVEEALEHCGKLGDLQDTHRTRPDVLNRGTFDVLYPSLADIDRLSKDPGAAAGCSQAQKAPPFDPVSYLSSFNHSRLSRDRRGKVPVSKALKLIEQQGRNLAAAEHWGTRLNGMCEHFLGWTKAAHKGELFLDICNSDTLVRPLNADDKHLLHRLHWLAVALYRAVKDPSIIPAPPRMSFIVCRDDFTGVLDTSEEDNEIGLLVATKCSCLPLHTQLSVTMKNSNTVQLKHPKMHPGSETLPCTLVQGETYVYYFEYHVFMPIWCVLMHYIRKYDGIPWRFEPNRQERDRENQVLGKNSTAKRTNVDPNSGDYGASSSSGAVFDLTVQSSTVRRGREKKTEQPSVSRRPRNLAGLPLAAAVSVASPDGLRSTSTSADLSPVSGQAAKNVAFATVRRNRVTVPATLASAETSLTSPTPQLRPPLPPPPPPPPPTLVEASPSASDARNFILESSVAVTVEVRSGDANVDNASRTSDTTADLASCGRTNTSSIVSATPPATRQETASVSAMMCRTQLFPASAAAPAPSAATDSTMANVIDNLGEESTDSVTTYRRSDPQRADAGSEKEVIERENMVGRAAVNTSAVLTPSCTISCSPSSQAMVSRETFNCANMDFDDYEGEETTETSTVMMYSESRRILRNFTASVVQESERNGIAILSHHFRVSGGPIGKGAFGAVYKALNLDTGRIVAVKQSRVSYDDKTTDLNWREFQTWSMLPLHANVIIFYGASKEVDTHQLLLVMEYASGGSIVQLYRQFRPIPEALFYDHAWGMACGIKHLHDHNVIHGDVKPENVLTRSDGSVAITDFGCSRFSLVTSDSDSSTLRCAKKDSSSWQLFGTAAYMAPEVILNEPHLKSDVWAYACTLLQLWLGRSPWSGGERRFSAQDSIPLMFYIANEDVVPYTEEHIANAPRWLQRIAHRAFEREVDKRCTMAEILGILTEYSRAYLQ